MKFKGKINWCKEQKKGLKIVKPNDNLSDAYLKKANESLKVMKKINDISKEWSLSTAYYARYNAIYSLMTKCGIKSEIHDCTLATFKFLFKDEFDSDLFKEAEKSKNQRINSQYYTNRHLKPNKYKENLNKTPEFVLKLESFIKTLTKDKINEKREKLKNLIEK